VLVLQRRSDDAELAGFWEIPGGYVEPEESLFEGLRREIAEETGLGVPQAPKLSDFFDYHSATGALTCELNFLVHLDQECELGSYPEHVAYRWVVGAQVRLLHCSEEARRSLLKALHHSADINSLGR
jgi:8-oxo-dGTP pyrophosphatase MutT (NUDIX family)